MRYQCASAGPYKWFSSWGGALVLPHDAFPSCSFFLHSRKVSRGRLTCTVHGKKAKYCSSNRNNGDSSYRNYWEDTGECDVDAPTSPPVLLLGFWSMEALSKVASAIGTPLNTDRFTTDRNGISYARVLVEVDISPPILDELRMDTLFVPIQQNIEYDFGGLYFMQTT
ncbi:hypothetical protein MTR67_012693 [Solanum verrucosum]|uniref:Uncharacterized protein n=1 Tax=Solanum verrucosum TaxID=315347 RepID=A0AAF0QAV9_SOLVR|nr:hypothetical protein MTR67_012693 [Solanum verrucosum]